MPDLQSDGIHVPQDLLHLLLKIKGVAKLLDRTSFAGSEATADRLVRTMVQVAGCSVPDAVRMITENPARVMGISILKILIWLIL